MIEKLSDLSEDLDLPVPVIFALAVVFALGSAYVMAFPGRMARAQLRKKYGDDWERYEDVSKGRLTAIFVGALCFLVLGLAVVVVAGVELFGPG